jgi:hypothetical protein
VRLYLIEIENSSNPLSPRTETMTNRARLTIISFKNIHNKWTGWRHKLFKLILYNTVHESLSKQESLLWQWWSPSLYPNPIWECGQTTPTTIEWDFQWLLTYHALRRWWLHATGHQYIPVTKRKVSTEGLNVRQHKGTNHARGLKVWVPKPQVNYGI